MKRSGEHIEDYSDEYYQSSLRYIEDYEFVNRVFTEAPALVTKLDSGTKVEPYAGEPYDAATQKVEPGGWTHEHCYVCGWSIEPGDSYWQNLSGLVLCDECHDFVTKDERRGRR